MRQGLVRKGPATLGLAVVLVCFICFTFSPSPVLAQTEDATNSEAPHEEANSENLDSEDLDSVEEPDSEDDVEEESKKSSTEKSTSSPAGQTSKKKEPKQRHMKVAKIPATGKSQMWWRSQSYLEYFGDNFGNKGIKEQFGVVVNQLGFGVASRFKKWSTETSARVDTHNLVQFKDLLCDGNKDGIVDMDEADGCTYRNDYRLERFTFRADTKYLRVTLGDFNVSFGRGVGLSLRKITSLGVDATIKGARLDLRTKPIDLTVLAGHSNRQHSVYQTREVVPDPGYRAVRCLNKADGGKSYPALLSKDRLGNRLWTLCSDRVVGGRLDAKLPGKVQLGTHYTYIDFGERQEIIGQAESLHLVGGDIARAQIAKKWDLFAGATALLRNPHLKSDPDLNAFATQGLAMYMQHNFIFGSTVATIEGKYYSRYRAAYDTGVNTSIYVEPPALERADQIVPAAFDVAGGRLRIDHIWRDLGLTIYGNAMAYTYVTSQDGDMFDRDEAILATHNFVGMIYRRPKLTAMASAGYRLESYLRHYEPGKFFKRKFPHAEFYVSFPVSKAGGFGHSLAFRGEGRWEDGHISGAPPELQKKFARGMLLASYNMAPYLSISLIGGFATEFVAPEGEPVLQPNKPCLVDAETKEYICQRTPHLWPGVMVRVNFLGTSYFEVFGGRQVGGILCANGVCRVVPDFEGVRGTLVLAF